MDLLSLGALLNSEVEQKSLIRKFGSWGHMWTLEQVWLRTVALAELLSTSVPSCTLSFPRLFQLRVSAHPWCLCAWLSPV